MSCSNTSDNCACPAPVQNKKTASYYFMMMLLAALLIVAFNLVHGWEEEALSSQNIGMVFILGFLTGLHCIGMCGGFMMSYMRYGKKAGLSELGMHSQYAVSKVVSYAFFGAAFGLFGSIVHFSSDLKSLISILGGFFLLYLGAKGLGLFKKIKLFPFIKKANIHKVSSPIGIGLLKGIMISCAPLQALYLISASLGDPLKGAVLLAVFGLGTLPIFLCYGVFLETLTALKRKWADIATASILVLFGVLMVNRGMALGGFQLSMTTTDSQVNEYFMADPNDVQIIKMQANKEGWSKTELHYQYGQKIRWEIQVTELTMCNKIIEIPKLGIKKELHTGLNILEFDPQDNHLLTYTCWMGMLNGTFTAQKQSKP